MKSLADKLHAQKLKLGLYINLGTDHATCGTIGSYGMYGQDAKTMAAWGMDLLKVDYCSTDPTDHDPTHHNANAPAGGWMPTIPTQLASWQQLRDALNATGRPIYTEFCPRSYSASSCENGKNCLIPPNKTLQDCNPGERCINDGPPHEWSGETRQGLANAILTEFGNSHDSWESAMSNLDALIGLRPQPDVDGPGFFSDGDMLQTCNFGFGGTNCEASKPGSCPSKLHMKQAEYQAQFAIWAVMASQMIISADLRTVQTTQPACFKLLLNQDILAVSQDPAAHAPEVVLSQNASTVVVKDGHNETKVSVTAQAFSRRLHDGSVALVMLNRRDRGSLTLTVTWAELGVAASGPCKVRDLIAQKDLPDATGSFSASVGPHEAQMVRVSCSGAQS